MRYNKLAQLPDAIGKLTSLRTLDVSHNQVWTCAHSLRHTRSSQALMADMHAVLHTPHTPANRIFLKIYLLVLLKREKEFAYFILGFY